MALCSFPRILVISSKDRELITHYVDLLIKNKKVKLDTVSRSLYIEKTLRAVYLKNEWEHVKNKVKNLEFLQRDISKKKLVFNINSQFKSIKKYKWKSWIKRYGFEYVQNILSYLDENSKRVTKSAEGLVYKALNDGAHWAQEKQLMDTAKKREEEWEEEKQVDKNEAKQTFGMVLNLVSDDVKEAAPIMDKDESDFQEAIMNESLVNNAKFIILETDQLFKKSGENHPMFKKYFKWKLLELYRNADVFCR